jgi:hypothetical protein
MFRYCTNFGAKRAELVQLMHKFVQRSRIGIVRNERNQSTPVVAKHMFWGISERFITAQTSVQNGPNWGT